MQGAATQAMLLISSISGDASRARLPPTGDFVNNFEDQAGKVSKATYTRCAEDGVNHK